MPELGVDALKCPVQRVAHPRLSPTLTAAANATGEPDHGVLINELLLLEHLKVLHQAVKELGAVLADCVRAENPGPDPETDVSKN